VDVAFTAGDTDADDFGGTLPETQTVTFAADEMEKTVVITGSGDTDVEADETFTVSLETPVGATIDETASTADGIIVNDDAAPEPVISIAADDSADQDEGDEGTTEFTFTVTRSGDLSGESTVDVDFFPGDTDAADFVGGFPETQTIQFVADEDTKTVTIAVSGDLDVEDDETFALTLENATNALIDETANDATGSIRNDDVPDLNVIDGTDGPDVLQGTEGNDVIRGFDDNDILLGNGGNDIIQGGDDEDVLAGGEGNDVLAGGNNSDSINGGAGNDILFGGDGEDVLRGDEDNDILTGGLRSDVFLFDGDFGDDIITDFDDNQDGVFFEGADKEDITTEIFREGTLITVESDITNGSVLLLGIDDVDGINI
jgi:Ca2+-binding RTX toxin-like protein